MRRFLCQALLATGFMAAEAHLSAGPAPGRTVMDVSGAGWKLWPDTNAVWQDDALFLPPVSLPKLPVNPPTGGWGVLESNGLAVSVPGTVEEHLSPGTGPTGDYQGVSWWWRTIRVPEDAGAHIVLHFESQRQRAEVYLNHQLVGYDVIGGTPFEADLTGKVKPGQEYQLAVRITDPGGNYDWRDSSPFMWGAHEIPMSHGFGGITGPVELIATDPVFVDDIYVQNTPVITNVNVFATVVNTTGGKVSRDVSFDVFEKAGSDTKPAFAAELKHVELEPGDNVVTQQISLASAKLWDLDHPNLYVCQVRLAEDQKRLDIADQTFGFRWFAPEGFGSNAMFRLNGKRIVLRTAISWSFWPINGIFPTPALAEKQIRDAKAFGLNMLNFHRCIGQPPVFDQADKLGLLYYEEPGGYKSASDSFSQALMREKVLRMAKRDRSHPSLVIFSLINERDRYQAFQPRERADLLAMHKLDPSRTITLSSSWAQKPDEPEPIKAQMRPFDDQIHFTGWFDVHHAGGPEVWRQSLYRSPTNYYNYTTDRDEIVYWGEEGAISSPPRLDLIKAALDASPVKGWDGEIYLDWYRRFNDFLARKHLREAFPTLQALTTSMGAVSLYHQGRKIETIRIGDVTDGYAINGWEAESIEDHSGIVDCWRNPKGDPSILAYYNQPLYVAVKTRSQFAQIPGRVAVDFYGINEENLYGEFTLNISVQNPSGGEMFSTNLNVKLTGGDVYGELLAQGIVVPVAGATGVFEIRAALADDASGDVVAKGHDEVLAVDWQNQKLGGVGATWENDPVVRDFLAEKKGFKAEAYRDDLGKLDWVIVTRPPGEGQEVEIPAEAFGSGLTTTFYDDGRFGNEILMRTDRAVDFFVPDGSVPDPQANVAGNYTARWEGKMTPPASGEYTFATDSSDGVRLFVDGKLLYDDLYTHNTPVHRARIVLTAGKAVALRLDLWHRKGNAHCKLLWAPPEVGAPNPARLIQRVRDDGTTLLILDRAESWMRLITNNTAATYDGSFEVGTAWLGGLHFVVSHPLFKDLPVNTAMSWPYQAVVRNGRERTGLRLEGEQLVVGVWHSYPMDLGTAVGVIPCGKGKLIVSTLDIVDQLNSPDTSADVARKLLCNFIAYH
jgi:PA14 domain/Glycosyl hydrolases family 2/Glycosyl hydrolases family 2, sugar binding domain/Glycosyl hydrolases family 2, TIM barrel domain